MPFGTDDSVIMTPRAWSDDTRRHHDIMTPEDIGLMGTSSKKNVCPPITSKNNRLAQNSNFRNRKHNAGEFPSTSAHIRTYKSCDRDVVAPAPVSGVFDGCQEALLCQRHPLLCGRPVRAARLVHLPAARRDQFLSSIPSSGF